MILVIPKGTTSKRIEVFIQDNTVTDGGGLTGLAFNSSGITWHYSREDQGNVGATAVTLATMTRGTWASGGFVEKDATNLPGVYQIGIPDAVLATGAEWAVMTLKGAASMAPRVILIQLSDAAKGLGAPSNLDATISAVKTKTDNLPATPAATGDAMTLTAGERTSTANALLDLANGIGTKTPRQILQALAVLAIGTSSGMTASGGNVTFTFGALTLTATLDASGNKSAVAAP